MLDSNYMVLMQLIVFLHLFYQHANRPCGLVCGSFWRMDLKVFDFSNSVSSGQTGLIFRTYKAAQKPTLTVNNKKKNCS